MRVISRTVLSLVLLPLLFLTACDEDDVGPRVRNGDPAPAFSLPTLSGKTLRVPDDLTGKRVVLRFWADWCPHCRKEMTAIEPIYQAQKDDGLAILAINVGQSRETAAAFVESLGISYGVLLDEESAVARRYHVVGLPTTFFVDRSGTVQGKILGEATTESFQKMVNKLE